MINLWISSEKIHWLDGRSQMITECTVWLWPSALMAIMLCSKMDKVVGTGLQELNFMKSGLPNFNCKFYLEWCWQYCQKKCVLESLWEACPTRVMGPELVPSCWVGLDFIFCLNILDPTACADASEDPMAHMYIRTHSYLPKRHYIAYHIILFIGTNYTSIINLFIVYILSRSTRNGIIKHVLNMWTPTKRYIISSYQCYILNYKLSQGWSIFSSDTGSWSAKLCDLD